MADNILLKLLKKSRVLVYVWYSGCIGLARRFAIKYPPLRSPGVFVQGLNYKTLKF